jgi:hypothetical protein
MNSIKYYAKGDIIVDDKKTFSVEVDLEHDKEYSPTKIKDLLVKKLQETECGEKFHVTNFSMGSYEIHKKYVIITYNNYGSWLALVTSRHPITLNSLIEFFEIDEEKDDICMIEYENIERFDLDKEQNCRNKFKGE